MSDIDVSVANGRVTGRCDPAFQSVADAFVENFNSREEVGASVCVNVAGVAKVDLWGGLRESSGAQWEQDTISIVFSCTKAATALCAHMLIDREELDLDARVLVHAPEQHFSWAGARIEAASLPDRP